MSKSIRKEEFIVCAAVRFTVESIGYEDRDSTYETILCTHYDDKFVEDKRFELCGLGYEVATNEYLGFVTNKGRFVDQKEALEITGWKNKLYFKDKEYLTPEDLLYYQSLIY